MSILLNNTQIEQRINRIAYQIYEDTFEEKEIIIAGIANGGFQFAKRIVSALEKIGSMKIHLIALKMDKNNHAHEDVKFSDNIDLKNKVVILIDDVLNSGKTLTYALRPFLNADVRKIRTVLLVDRDHKRYPLHADFVGLTLSTTLKEHVSVDLSEGNESVVLS